MPDRLDTPKQIIERLDTRKQLCHILRTEYVILLGQRGTGVKTFISDLLEKKSPIGGMKFIAVALPEGTKSDDGFQEIVLRRLVRSVHHFLPDNIFPQEAQKRLENQERPSLRRSLEILGEETTAQYLVIILYAFKRIAPEPFENLLLLLRDCHHEKDIPGAASEKLRFLFVGYLNLWRLCYSRSLDDLSPFVNIAEHTFLEGISPEEIEDYYENMKLELATAIRRLTDGVPSLVKKVVTWEEHLMNLSPIFSKLQCYWNSLPEDSPEILKRLVEGAEEFPRCRADYFYSQIPKLESPWLETFWRGFLKMENRKLTWRSLFHRAFVEEQANLDSKFSKQALEKIEEIRRVIHGDTLQAEQTSTATPYPVSETSTGEEFDVFLAHNSADKAQIEVIGEALKQRGLKSWIDKEQIPPGRWFQDAIQQAISHVKAAAIIIGSEGLGKWQAVELRSFISQCVEQDIPVIPVLLPGVTELPKELLFLKELNWVRFNKSLDEDEALDSLVWGITGEHPQKSPV